MTQQDLHVNAWVGVTKNPALYPVTFALVVTWSSSRHWWSECQWIPWNKRDYRPKEIVFICRLGLDVCNSQYRTRTTLTTVQFVSHGKDANTIRQRRNFKVLCCPSTVALMSQTRETNFAHLLTLNVQKVQEISLREKFFVWPTLRVLSRDSHILGRSPSGTRRDRFWILCT